LASPSREVGLRAFVDAYDLVLCDVFGTLHDETGIFPDAIEALVRFRDSGRVVILLSNSAYPGAALADHLTSRGVPASAFDAIVTSADVTRTLLDDCQGTVHHIGLPAERVLFEDMPVAFAQVEAADLVVCTGCPEEEFAPASPGRASAGLSSFAPIPTRA
jgi:ribonucleotide monophosphatase NagD (HAD superfamily)